jgi:hypothetical protein
MEGRCATEVDPSSAAAQEIKALVKEITALISDPAEETDEEETAKNLEKNSSKELADA